MKKRKMSNKLTTLSQSLCFEQEVSFVSHTLVTKEGTRNYLIKDFGSKKRQRRLPGCHLRLGKKCWWRGTRSFGRGCCLGEQVRNRQK